ncbi:MULTISPECIES: stage II sporulation protein M [Bacillus]|jgi:uncharacterized membrane protein SpoIIM required for sporulation|uniref:stage II sporulation protein M n=1 Tax=Bacillus TaxID=1386 RepID=UPI0006718481|nr:stage II sporulation protein M [Bacillus smithii]AKP46125.1 Hypothetical protein BSM4216_0791 [Bacillus smithii]MED4885347.1 stage II sporulation protein M [Bacillus smithii]MED4928579.1 stage II sporulation protein M [Bacillus smithii]
MKVKHILFLGISLGIFILFFLIGFLTASPHPQEFKQVNVSFLSIYSQNLKVAFLIILTGVISMGMMPILLLAQNALIFGIGVKNILFAPKMIGLILLHGSIEMPMFIVATYLSLSLTYKIFKNRRYMSIRTVVFISSVIVLGLLVAGLLEAFVTPTLIK